MLVASSISVRMGKANLTTISVSPITKTVQVGEQFAINISLDYAENLYGFEIWLSFDNSKLNATAINYVNYLNDPHRIWYQQVNNAGGYVTLAVSSTFPAPAKTGGSPPPLATVNFTAIDLGSSALHLYNTILSDDQAKPIPHTTVDGIVHVTGGTHDVAVTDIKSSKTVIGQGYKGNITVTAENHGGFTETFNVTAYANTTAIETQTVNSMPNGTSTILTFTWNTTGFAKGNYTIWAYAWPVPGETDTADNTYEDGWVLVSCVGDVNGDKKTTIADIVLVIGKFGTTPSSPEWNPNMDIDGNDKVTIGDIVITINNFGNIWT
jgi:hypothetical protein